MGITTKLFGKLPSKTRVYYALDATLLGAFVTIIITGVLMSRAVFSLFGLQELTFRVFFVPFDNLESLCYLLSGLHSGLLQMLFDKPECRYYNGIDVKAV